MTSLEEEIMYRVSRYNPEHRRAWKKVMESLMHYWHIRWFLQQSGQWISVEYVLQTMP